MAKRNSIKARVSDLVCEHLGVDPQEVTMTARFIEDLDGDSLDSVELVMGLEEEFQVEIPDDAAEAMKTVGDAVRYLEQHSHDAQAA